MNKEPLFFRPVRSSEHDRVIELWRACGLTRPWNDPVKDIAFATGQDNACLLVGMRGAEIVATVMVGHDGHRGTVYYVAVDPAHQGKGYGRQVMRAAEDWLIDKGVWKLNLLVRAENAKVRSFYERLGYEIEERLCMARKLIER